MMQFLFYLRGRLANVDIASSISFHKKHGKLATVTAILPPGRFGALIIDGDVVHGFIEKTLCDGDWTNGVIFVLKTKVIDYIDSDACNWEKQVKPLFAARTSCFHFNRLVFDNQ